MSKKMFMMMMTVIIKIIIVKIKIKNYSDSNKINKNKNKNMSDQLTDYKTKCLTRGIICLRLLLLTVVKRQFARIYTTSGVGEHVLYTRIISD